MYASKSLREAPAKFVHPYTGAEILTMDVDKKLDVVVTWRTSGKVCRTTVRLDDNGERYFPARGVRVYLSDLRSAKYAGNLRKAVIV